MDTRIILNADKKYGCAICFERFDKDEKVLVCQEPCNKLFHPECFYKSVEEVSLCDIKCCYCKRTLITKENLFDRKNTVAHTICEMHNIYIVCEPKNPLSLLLDKPEPNKKKPNKMPKRGAIPPDPPMRTLYNRGCRGRAPKG
jgi:hypothetical protein